MPKFRARPVNKRVLESSGDMGVPKVPKVALTAPVEPHFHIEERLATRPKPVAEEQKEEFHARPLNEKILQQPTFIAQPSNHALTQPKTPNLRTRRRAAERPPSPVEEEIVPFTARGMPHMETPFKEKLEKSAAMRAAHVTLTDVCNLSICLFVYIHLFIYFI